VVAVIVVITALVVAGLPFAVTGLE